ncbi:oxysterol-binding protein-related protein 11-like [Rhopilema esculentum]|uniref:oxysterol-binding protein-related protein 11-like n=1 Tax=Rhopilema esculentum TaxID=499914 RepID=UPI0031CE77AB|eukprot:gene12780-3514_t
MSAEPRQVYYAALHARGLNPSEEELDLDGQSWLTEEEKIKIKEVMVREKEFISNEAQGHMRNKSMEGQLSKFTNLVKGWQNRWFALDAEHGTLSYFLEKDKVKHGPRGSVHLSGAVIAPSDEDSNLFIVHASNGDVYKLRATDPKNRQHWVNMIRAVAEFHSLSPKQEPPSDINAAALQRTASLGGAFLSKASNLKRSATYGQPSSRKPQLGKQVTTPAGEELHNVKDALNTVDEYHATVVETLENDSHGDIANPLDENVLILKATSQAMVNILHQCYSILHQQSADLQATANATGLPPGARIEWLGPSDTVSRNDFKTRRSGKDEDYNSDEDQCDEFALKEEEFTHIRSFEHSEVLDEHDFEESEESMEPHRNIILSILSQLKLGMDLTRVVLPTFVLEKRSLLEMYADFFSHPDLFTRIPDFETPQDRMLAVLEFYLTSFHVGRKSAVAKKPYNPIIGETFHCSYDVPSQNQFANSSSQSPTMSNADGTNRLFYVAEQVSHHPPISAFYAECPDKKITMNTHIWTKSKFYGMSIGVVNVGEGIIIDHVHDEEYIITFPNAYCRSILTNPWIELGGRTMIKCVKTGYAAVVLFHTKPFYGGSGNKISAEIKDVQTGDIYCRAEGSWNGSIEFAFTDDEKKDRSIDIRKLRAVPKRVRPLDHQGEFESRRLWRDVTLALNEENLESATVAKHKLEERQRAEERQRQSLDIKWKTKLFRKVDDGWWFNKHVKQRRKKKSSTSS